MCAWNTGPASKSLLCLIHLNEYLLQTGSKALCLECTHAFVHFNPCGGGGEEGVFYGNQIVPLQNLNVQSWLAKMLIVFLSLPVSRIGFIFIFYKYVLSSPAFRGNVFAGELQPCIRKIDGRHRPMIDFLLLMCVCVTFMIRFDLGFTISKRLCTMAAWFLPRSRTSTRYICML